MKKVIIKTVVSLSALVLTVVSSIGAAPVFADEYNQTVPLKSYQPAVKQLVVDDNLEGVTQYPIATALTASNSIVESGTGNTAFQLNNWNGVTLVAANQPIYADKLVVSFDVKATGTSFAEAVESGKFDAAKRSPVGFGIRAGGSGETGVMFSASGTTIADATGEKLQGWAAAGASPNSKGGNIIIPQNNAQNNGYVNVTAVFERKSDGVYMKNLYFDGVDTMIDSLRLGFNTVANWWSADSYARLFLQNRSGNALYNYYDNFLVYVPEEFAVKDTEVLSNGTGVKMSFNAALSRKNLPTFILTDENGQYECSCEVGDNDNELRVEFPTQLDTENKSYYLEFDKAVSAAGDELAGFKIVIGKRYIYACETTVVRNGTSLTADICVTPAGISADVYAAVVVFTDDRIIDFKLEKVTLDATQSENRFTVNLSNSEMASANRIQAFMLESPKSMRIICDVEDKSL